MRIPYTWLKEYVPTDLSPEQMGHELTMGGVEVEQVAVWEDASGPAEPVLVTKVTANRGDLLSVIGTARQAAAVTAVPFMPPSYTTPATDAPVTDPQRAASGPVTVEIVDAVGCPRYSGLLIEGVQVSPSPDWMRRRLEASGIRAINNVVDCTNYVLLELGQPLHAFDFSLLAEGHIIVRKASPGEKMTTLDGQERLLTAEDLLICDPRGPVALAGVMGGGSTEVHAGTTAVLLEAAHFDAPTVRRTSLRLGLSSEASYRFERHVDPNLTLPALARVAELIIQTSGGEVPGPAVDVKTRDFAPRLIALRAVRCNAVLGSELSARQMADLLERVGCAVTGADTDTLQVTIPTFRPEVEREIDLIEEVAIVHGYNNITLTIPGKLPGSAVLTLDQRLERRARQLLRACGLNETISFSMVSPRLLELAGLGEQCAEHAMLSLANPMSDEYCSLRTTLLPSLLASVQNNVNQRVLDVALYELDRVFLPRAAGELPDEPRRVAGLLTGSPFTSNWNLPEKGDVAGRSVDFWWLKGIVEQLCRGLGIEQFSFTRAAHPSFHPGRCARLLLGESEAGVLGEIASPVREAFDLPGPTYAFELDFELLARHANLVPTYQPLPRFPAALRDVAVLVPDSDESSAERLEQVIRAVGGDYLVAVEPFDLFADEQRLGLGRKSVAFHLRFRASDRALTSEELDGVMQAIHRCLEQELGAEVRTA